MENLTWERIDSLKESNKKELATEIDKSMENHSHLTIILGQKETKEAQKAVQKNELKELTAELDKIKKETTLQQQQIESHQGDLRERETTIRDKEQKINRLKTTTMELEKFKFVLDYKIKDLKRQIGPREEDIQNLNESTTKMN